MGWGPPQNLSHLIRDDLRLTLSCPCGHVATPDICALRKAMWRRCGGESLDDLPRVLRYSQCGGRQVKVELSKSHGYTAVTEQPAPRSSLMQSEPEVKSSPGSAP